MKEGKVGQNMLFYIEKVLTVKGTNKVIEARSKQM